MRLVDTCRVHQVHARAPEEVFATLAQRHHLRAPEVLILTASRVTVYFLAWTVQVGSTAPVVGWPSRKGCVQRDIFVCRDLRARTQLSLDSGSRNQIDST